jgi:putative transposase
VKLIREAVSAGARQRLACGELGLTERTFQRWHDATGAVRVDARPSAVRPAPANKLSADERTEVLQIVNETRFASLPPTQIVPTLADEGRYVASESTMYRILRAEKQLEHRGAARAPVRRPVPQHCAQAPNQLWCWDITYLSGPIHGMFFFLHAAGGIMPSALRFPCEMT